MAEFYQNLCAHKNANQPFFRCFFSLNVQIAHMWMYCIFRTAIGSLTVRLCVCIVRINNVPLDASWVGNVGRCLEDMIIAIFQDKHAFEKLLFIFHIETTDRYKLIDAEWNANKLLIETTDRFWWLLMFIRTVVMYILKQRQWPYCNTLIFLIQKSRIGQSKWHFLRTEVWSIKHMFSIWYTMCSVHCAVLSFDTI